MPKGNAKINITGKFKLFNVSLLIVILMII